MDAFTEFQQLFQQRRIEEAWSLFLDTYRRLLFATVRTFANDRDDVMEMFAHVCAELSANDCARLRRFVDDSRRASFSTWLVVVVRNLCVDWLRARDGRQRDTCPNELSPMGSRIYSLLFVEGCTHAEARETIASETGAAFNEKRYREELREVFNVVFSRKSRGKHTVTVPADVDGPPSPFEQVVSFDASAKVARLLGQLEPSTRLAVVMFVVDGTPAADIARALGWPDAKSVYNRVYRALAAMRRELDMHDISRDDLIG